ncbi:helix-turn-helix transcriptional regulator [Endozoicomonas atrinae]|uniref:helix-turn-helix transcriptional regulator n=1 Tax=Endozoicomonas atrinae TaxID=1333660 RepID=UPI0009F341AF|nr:helix-turn-helix domain-containing protein [Endozoicomonas atrinae]
MEQKKLMRVTDILREYHLSKSTFYKIIRNGEFPEPVSLGKGIQKLYRRSDVEAFFGC